MKNLTLRNEAAALTHRMDDMAHAFAFEPSALRIARLARLARQRWYRRMRTLAG